MAKYKNSVFGTITGSVGDNTATKWKGEKVLKTKPFPANPKSAGQVSQRDKFFLVSAVGKLLLASVIKEYWDKKYSKMSGYNGFTKVNLNRVASGAKTDADGILVTNGSYEPIAELADEGYVSSSGELTVKWDSTVLLNGSPDDIVVAVGLNLMDYDISERKGIIYSVIDTSAVRSDGDTGITMNLYSGATSGDIVEYVGLVSTDGDMGDSKSIFPTVT